MYDTWRHDGTGFYSWDNVLAFQVAMKSRWDEAVDLIFRLLNGDDISTLAGLTNEGRAILRYEQQEMKQASRQASFFIWCWRKEDEAVRYANTLALNTSYNPARMGDLLWTMFPDADLLVAYTRTSQGRWKYSLRSPKGHGANCAEIAQHFGGGGHFHAAGFYSDDLLAMF